MGYFLFGFWLVFLGWVLIRTPFVRHSGLASRWTLLLFLGKVAGGVLFGWLTRHDPTTDTWRYHADGLQEYELLFRDPLTYITNLFQSGYADGYDGLLRSRDSYWNDLRANLMIKLVSLLDICSGGRYYVNVVVYNFLTFFGCIALFRLGKEIFRTRHAVMAVAVFGLPSVWLYGSALHKEGILLACLGFFLYGFRCRMHRSHARYWLMMLPSVLIIFLFRPYIVAALIPALLAFVWAHHRPGYPLFRVYGVVYTIAGLLFFGLPLLLPALNFPAIVAQKQAAFLALGPANTSLPAEPLLPEAGSFIRQLPQAVQHVLLRPWLTDYRLSLQLIPHILEWGTYFLLVILWWRFRDRKVPADRNFTWMTLCFCASVWLFIGYTVPVLGAIIRYRALYLPLILAPVLAQTDWKSIGRKLKMK